MTDTWDTIADWYAARIRTGSPMHTFARDLLLSHLPADLHGQHALDLGCGEGLITRALAARGATALGVDPAPRMIGHAQAAHPTDAHATSARYAVDDARTLATVPGATMHWVTAGLSLNNVPDLPAALSAVSRVLRPGGHLVLTVPHPCFEAPHAGWTSDDNGTPRRLIGDYLTEGFWRSSDPEAARRAGNQHRTLSTYLTTLIAHGFTIDATAEPAPDTALAAARPHRAGLPPFLLVRAYWA